MKRSYNVLSVITLVLITVMCMSAAAFAEGEPEWKPMENKDKFAGMEYKTGMFSAAAKGTAIVLNDDGTVTLNVTTVPMTSTKYTKVAFSMTELSLSDTEALEQAAQEIPVTVGTAEDKYIGQFDGIDYGIKPYYWSCFSYTMPVEALKDKIYTAAYNVLKVVDSDKKIYEEDLEKAKWAYASYWQVVPTADMVNMLRSKQAETSDEDLKARIGAVITYFEGELLQAARTAIDAAKADLTNKALVEAALEAIDSLTEEQKAELTDDIKTLTDAKAAIEKKEADEKAKKEAEAKAKKEKAKVQAAKVTGLKAKAAKKKMTVTWKKNTVFQGYQIQYKLGKKAKTVKITKASVTKKVIKKLKSRKKYQVKIRGYKKVSGSMTYGKWSAVKTVKIK